LDSACQIQHYLAGVTKDLIETLQNHFANLGIASESEGFDESENE